MQAILITAYKNIDHLERIIDFFGEGFNIYIHFDKKSISNNVLHQQLKEKKNIKYISSKYNINWGGINHLLAILNISREALNCSENSYFHLITGHDFPIKKREEFNKFFDKNDEFSFLENNKLPYEPWPEGGLDRLSRYNLYDIINARSGWKEILVKRISKVQKTLGIKRTFDKNFPQLYGGSTYWSLNRQCLQYTFDYMNQNPLFLKRFKYSFCSEEIFFQTILLNSPQKEQIVNDNLRFIVWEKRNGNFPANLDMTDYENIKISNAFFARKFEFPISKNLLESILKNT